MNFTRADWIQIITGFVTSVGIIISLCTSIMQLKNSNKQSLFDRRLSILMLAEGFKNLLEANKDLLKVPIELDDTCNALYFRQMINNDYLSNLWKIIPEPQDINAPSTINDPIATKEFLIKKEEILKKGKEAELIFKKPENKIISDFINDYINLLDGRRRYDIAFREYKNSELKNEDKRIDPTTKPTSENFLKEHTNEEDDRNKFLVDPVNNLEQSLKKYKASSAAILKQLTLK